MVVCRRSFALKPLSAPLPSLCHAGPSGFVLRIVRKPSRALALSGMLQEFLSGVNRHISRLKRISNRDVNEKFHQIQPIIDWKLAKPSSK
jgi:hypothetical protein